MTSNILSQSSNDSTYCSELEKTEELKDIRKFKINFKPTADIISLEKVGNSSTSRETFNGLESKCKEKLNELTKYYEESLDNFHKKFVCFQENSSPPLLSSTNYSQLEYEEQVKQSNARLLQLMPANTQPDSSKQDVIINQVHNPKDLKRTHQLKRAPLEAIHCYKSKNKIFQTEERSNSLNHKNNDTFSITSERVSKIVDSEIAVHRKKQRTRTKQKSQKDFSRICFQQDPSCPCFTSTTNCQHHPPPSSMLRSQYRKFNTIRPTEKNSLPKSPTQISQNYKLTRCHIGKIAKYFKINTNELISAIENILNGHEIGEQTSDEIDEIICSQSPIKRRYNCSQ